MRKCKLVYLVQNFLPDPTNRSKNKEKVRMTKTKLLGAKWESLNMLYEGSGILVYKARNKLDNTLVAVNLEDKRKSRGKLSNEYNAYCSLNGEKSSWAFPRVFQYGTYGAYDAIALDLLRPSLGDILHRFNGKFSFNPFVKLEFKW